MTQLDEIKKILEELKADSKELNTELKGIIRESTTALTRVNDHIDRPFYKNPSFWILLLQAIAVVILIYFAVNSGTCLEWNQLKINCSS